MSTTYNGSVAGLPVSPAQITIPVDGDPLNVASVNTALQKLADWCEFFNVNSAYRDGTNNTATTANRDGLRGTANGTGAGIRGNASATSGSVGVRGIGSATNGSAGVRGEGGGTTTGGPGVEGIGAGSSIPSPGVKGTSGPSGGRGVEGYAATGSGGSGGYFQGDGAGTGVLGASGTSASAIGVEGISYGGGGVGVRGTATAASGISVEGAAGGAGSTGGKFTGGASGIGVWGVGGSGNYGGDFYGGAGAPGLRVNRADGLTSSPAIVSNGTIDLDGSTNPASNTALKNKLAALHVPKLVAFFSISGTSVTLVDGVNVSSVAVHATDGTITITFAQAMANTNYMVLAQQQAPTGTPTYATRTQTGGVAAGSVKLEVRRNDTGALIGTSGLNGLSFAVLIWGRQ